MAAQSLLKTNRFYIFFFIFALILPPLVGHADDEAFKEQLLQNYTKLTSYCDKGRLSSYRQTDQFHLEKMELVPSRRFKRCFHSNGEFKVEEYDIWRSKSVYSNWTNGKIQHRYVGDFSGTPDQVESLKTLNYSEYSYSEYRKWNREEKHAAMIYYILDKLLYKEGFLWLLGSVNKRDLISYFNKYKINHKLSDDEFTILERKQIFERNEKNNEVRLEVVKHILWISNQDMLIKKYQFHRDSVIEKSIELDEVRINPTLSREDLWFDVPFITVYLERYSLLNSPKIFLSASYSISFFLGLVFWLLKFLRNKAYLDKSYWSNSFLGRHFKALIFIAIIPFTFIHLRFVCVKPEFLVLFKISFLQAVIYFNMFLIFLMSSHAAYWVFGGILSKKNIILRD